MKNTPIYDALSDRENESKFGSNNNNDLISVLRIMTHFPYQTMHHYK